MWRSGLQWIGHLKPRCLYRGEHVQGLFLGENAFYARARVHAPPAAECFVIFVEQSNFCEYGVSCPLTVTGEAEC